MNKVSKSAVLVLVFSGLFVSETSFAILRNPLIRECTRNGGNFEVYPLGSNDMALCRWNTAIIDSLSLVQNVEAPRIVSQAASAVLDDAAVGSCSAAQATDYVIPTGETLCFFADGSKLSLEVLKAGLLGANRLRLKEVIIAR